MAARAAFTVPIDRERGILPQATYNALNGPLG
jgi:hypothetical protein